MHRGSHRRQTVRMSFVGRGPLMPRICTLNVNVVEKAAKKMMKMRPM